MLVVLLRAALPYGVAYGIERAGGDALGRIVRVENVDLALLRGGLVVEGISVGPAPGPGEGAGPLAPEATVLGAGRIAAEVDWGSLIGGEVRIRSVTLDAPVVSLERLGDGSVTPIVLAPPAPADPEAGALPPIALDRLDIRNASFDLKNLEGSGRLELVELRLEHLSLTDFGLRDGVFSIGDVDLAGPSLRMHREMVLGRGEPAPENPVAVPVVTADTADEEGAGAEAPSDGFSRSRIASFVIERAQLGIVADDASLDAVLSLSLRDASLEPGARFPLKLRLEIGDGWVEVDGQAGAVPPAYDGALRWAGMQVPVLLTALGLESPVAIEALRSSGDVQLQLDLGDATTPGAATASGVTRVTDLALASERDGLRVTLASLEVEIEEIAAPLGGPGAPTIALTAVRVTNPSVDFTRRPAPAEIAASPAEPAPAATDEPRIRLAQLEISGGTLHFEDRTVTPHYETTLRDLTVSASGIRWPERAARDFRVRFDGPNPTSLELSGTLDGSSGQVELALQKLGLPLLNPYATQLGEYRIDRGDATLRSKLDFAGERIDVAGDLNLARLELSKSDAAGFEKAFGMPLDVSLALLRDPSGDIDLPIHFSLERDELRTSMWPTVLAAFRQALVGAVTLPLKAVQGLIPGESDELGLPAFAAAPGSAAPQDAAAVLGALAALLASHPELGIVLHGRVGAEDEAPLALEVLTDRARGGEDLPELDDVGLFARRRIRAAIERYGADATSHLEGEDRAALERSVAAVSVPEARRAALAAARAGAIRGLLLADHGVPAERVRVAQAESGAPGVVPEVTSLSSLPDAAPTPSSGETAAKGAAAGAPAGAR